MSEDILDWLSNHDEVEEENECDYEDPDDFEDYGKGCDFPDRCLMPGDHMRYECYTREMAEEWEIYNKQGAGAGSEE